MKTKNIFKTLAFVMLMSTMLLTTSCSSDDDFANTSENTEKKGFALPVTVNVTRQGDATRATYDAENKKLGFSAGDKLFVSGQESNTGVFAGVLTLVSEGTFSGTIITEKEYTGTADELFTAAGDGVYVELLPAGYETYGFFSINEKNGYDDELDWDYNKAFATTKATAVEQFCDEISWDPYSGGFTLSPFNAILNFTITGLTPSTEVSVVFSGNSEISKTVTTDESGNATFAIGVELDTELSSISLTVGGNAITLGDKTLEAGKIYNISRSAAPAAP